MLDSGEGLVVSPLTIRLYHGSEKFAWVQSMGPSQYQRAITTSRPSQTAAPPHASTQCPTPRSHSRIAHPLPLAMGQAPVGDPDQGEEGRSQGEVEDHPVKGHTAEFHIDLLIRGLYHAQPTIARASMMAAITAQGMVIGCAAL